jgi:hypothetical protein
MLFVTDTHAFIHHVTGGREDLAGKRAAPLNE